ncbi:helix-turn-helix domain-containing protein [Clostridioides sp. ZZV15-6597]|uniref:helix-turn-helix domain-containing protein n=1 Tax=Clostridioides sp. ZZV15-6597 TaxID=2811500 RepID=UPI001D1035F4|nr:helix-turn-helix domain-containing protein [Clostridioides sp. ZZV15-6597]
MNFSELLKMRRKEKGLTLSALDELSGVNASYINRIENGVNKTPSIEHALRLMKPLGISLEELRECYNLGNEDSRLIYGQKDNILIEKAKSELINIAINNGEYKNSLEKIIDICEELRKNAIKIIAQKENENYIVRLKLYDEKLIEIISKLLKEQYVVDEVLVIKGDIVANKKSREFELEKFLQGANEYFGILEDDEYLEINKYLISIGY